MFSLYSSIYRLSGGFIDYKSALDNFCAFADEVVIATSTDSKDNTIELLQEYQKNNPKVKLVITDFKLDSATFDGELKNAALQATTQPAKLLLDCDEFIPLSQKPIWIKYYIQLQFSNFDGLLIPSVNLCGDLNHYKDVSYKFYLHKEGFRRGVWKEALNSDGSIDISKSDTTEVLDKDGNLAMFAKLPNDIESLKSGQIPFVFHKWAVDFDKRIEQNKFWKPVWRTRANKEVNDIILNKEELSKIETFEHKLPLE